LQRYYNVTGQGQRALEIRREAYRIWQLSTDVDPVWNSVVSNTVGATALMTGDWETAGRFLQQGVAYSDVRYREAQILLYGEDMGITCRGFLAIAQWCLGYPDQARAMLLEARARAEHFSHSFSIGWTNTFAFLVLKYLEDPEFVHAQATANHAFAVEHGLASFEPLNLLFKTWAEAGRQQNPAAAEQIERIITLFEHIGFRFLGGFCGSLLAEAYRAAGRIGDALGAIDEAMDTTDRIGEEFFRPELYRLKGEFLLQQANPDAAGAAQSCFQQSLDVARQQQARGWELRTATSLARLWRDQGRGREARELLAPVYDWFTEGFETPDLEAARALLDELDLRS
jgi:predicted ATPase